MSFEKVRNHLIGVFVLVHLLYVGIAPMRFARPTAYAEGSTMRTVVESWEGVRAKVKEWGRPYGRYLGVRQAWGMFGNPSPVNGRVEIAYHDGKKWHNKWVDRSPKFTWKRHTFEHYRWREMLRQFHKGKTRRSWNNFAPWVADQVFAEHPDAMRVRIRVRNSRIPAPKVLRKTRRLKFNKKGWQRIVTREAS